jgi:hypothetical protein
MAGSAAKCPVCGIGKLVKMDAGGRGAAFGAGNLLGVNRVIFIGTRDEDNFPYELATFAENFLDTLRLPVPFSVWDAISDLPAGVVPRVEKRCPIN